MNKTETHEDHRIRVLIADDSFFIRTYLMEHFRLSPHIEVVGMASNGEEVIALAQKLHPDVITMDYNMPGKNGLEATAAIMLGGRPLPAVIMLSAFAGDEGARVRHMLEESGAHVIAKPSGEVSLDIEKIAGRIVAKIEEIGRIEMRIREAYSRLSHITHKRRPVVYHGGTALRAVVVIGASTGGPPLVEHVLSTLKPEMGIGVVIAQHMSKYFTELFAERLDRVTEFSVREASEHTILTPGTAFVIPGGHALSILTPAANKSIDTEFTITPLPMPHHEDAIDRTMTAIAESYGPRVFGVLLSGMGADGASGIGAIKVHNGVTITQDPTTAIVASMPEHALHGGKIDVVLEVEKISEWILEHIEERFS